LLRYQPSGVCHFLYVEDNNCIQLIVNTSNCRVLAAAAGAAAIFPMAVRARCGFATKGNNRNRDVAKYASPKTPEATATTFMPTITSCGQTRICGAEVLAHDWLLYRCMVIRVEALKP
jgi:hypothetical protein